MHTSAKFTRPLNLSSKTKGKGKMNRKFFSLAVLLLLLTALLSGSAKAAYNNFFYSADLYGGLFAINPDTLQVLSIGNTGYNPTDLASDGQGNLFGVTFEGDFLSINPDTAATTNKGNTGFWDVSGLDIRPGGPPWGVTNSGELFWVDTSNWLGNSVGSFGDYIQVGDLAFKDASTLYAVAYPSGSLTSWLVSVNLNNGYATPIGDTQAQNLTGLSFRNNTLWAVSSFGDIYTINTSNGSSTSLGNQGISFMGLTYLGSSSPPPPVIPTVTWIKPVGNGETYSASSGVVNLEVTATSDEPVVLVQFKRWDAVNNQWVMISEDFGAPWQSQVDIADLNIGANNIYAYAYEVNMEMGEAFIWIERTGGTGPPVADFYAEPTSGEAPLMVYFYNTSQGNFDSCVWEWGWGYPEDICDSVVPLEYSNPGVYTVSLTVSGPGGSDTKTITGYIHVTQPPPDTYSISGYIRTPSGTPINGVAITDGAGHQTSTNASGYYTFSGLEQGTYTLTPARSGYTFDPLSTMINVPPNQTGVNFTGMKDQGNGIYIPFRPRPHGYQFENSDSWEDQYDFTPSDLRRLFGDANVCFTTANGICLLTPTAQNWLSMVWSSLNGASCEGMAVTANRFYRGLDFPGDFYPGAQATWDLPSPVVPIENVRRNIAYFHTLQWSPSAKDAMRVESTQTPSEVLTRLEESFQQDIPDDPYVINLINKELKQGHAVVPYGIEQKGNNLWYIWIYDPNYPGETRQYIEVDRAADTWKYGYLSWEGDAFTQSLYAIHTSAFKPKQTGSCPFCKGQEAPNTLQIVLTSNGGNLTIADNYGNRLGYVGGQFVKEIPGGFASPGFNGGFESAEPTYYLPFGQGYSMVLDGRNSVFSEDVSLCQYGVGYGNCIYRTLSPSTHDEIVIYEDGTSIIFTPNKTGNVWFKITDDSKTDAGYDLTVNADVLGGRQFFLANYQSGGQLYVHNKHNSINGAYNLYISRVTANGQQTFYYTGAPLNPTDSHYVLYRDWDGGNTMTVWVDWGSDGGVDETIYLTNEIRIENPIYLPIISKR